MADIHLAVLALERIQLDSYLYLYVRQELYPRYRITCDPEVEADVAKYV